MGLDRRPFDPDRAFKRCCDSQPEDTFAERHRADRPSRPAPGARRRILHTLGSNLTEANPNLAPEKLYGAEIGFGGTADSYDWQVAGFYNQLHGAITNVTVAHGPVTVPGLGNVAAGGLLIQRRNAGNVDAYGIETD